MTITTTTLTRAAALAAIAGGLLYIAVQINHPPLDAPFTTTTEYTVPRLRRSPWPSSPWSASRALPAAGPPDRSARPDRVRPPHRRLPRHLQRPGHRCLRPPGPRSRQPGYVNDVLAVATSGAPIGDVSRMGPSPLAITYIIGGIVFGIALFRADVLARWASVLLSIGALATLATPLLPQLTQRLFAVPVGVALIGLGYSLWREQRTRTTRPVAGADRVAVRVESR